MPDETESFRAIHVRHVSLDGSRESDDPVAVEEPMEIRVAFGADERRSASSLSVTMRTPGHDFELAVGFLFTEGILQHPDQLRSVEFCGPAAPGRATSNIVKVELAPEVELNLDRMQRHFVASSSCGICGKASLDALHSPGLVRPEPDRPRISRALIHRMPELLRGAQPTFARTGGLHGAALVDAAGTLLGAREDVGRHNAVDKLLGRSFLDRVLTLEDRVMVLSGRASFEILQKALRAAVPMIVSVGAPSSLAVDMAERFGMTLVGFASETRFNIYTGFRRIS